MSKTAKSDGRMYNRYYEGDCRKEFIPGNGIELKCQRTDMIIDVAYDPARDRTKVKCVRTDPKNASVISIGVGKGA